MVARKAVLGRLGILSKLMGDRLDDVAAKNFVKIYERKLLLDPAIGKDYFDDFIKAMHSKGAGPTFKLDDIDDVAKDYLELFFKEPDPGSPWKLSTVGGNPPRNHFARGNLIELDAAKHGKYKNHDYLDQLSDSGPQEAVDFRKVTAQGTEYVQETSTMSNDVFTQQLGSLSTKLQKVAKHASDNGGNKAVLDVVILEGRNPDLSTLNALAGQLSDDLDIVVEVQTTVSKYAGWLAN